MSDSTHAKTGRQFLMEACRGAFHQAWHWSHVAHFVIVLLAGVAIMFAVHLHDYGTIIAVPLAVLVGVFVVGLFQQAYSIYCKEHDERIAAEKKAVDSESKLNDELKRLRAIIEDTERRQTAYLQLVRMAEDGESRLATFDARGHDTKIALTGAVDLQAWHKNTLAILEKEYAAHWGHFADIGKFGSGGPAGQTMAVRSGAAIVENREEIEILLKRIRDLRDLFLTAFGQKTSVPTLRH